MCFLLVFIQVLTKRHTVHKHVIVESLASKLVPGHRYNFWTICFISPSVLTVVNYFLNKKNQASFCQNWNRALFCTSSTKMEAWFGCQCLRFCNKVCKSFENFSCCFLWVFSKKNWTMIWNSSIVLAYVTETKPRFHQKLWI